MSGLNVIVAIKFQARIECQPCFFQRPVISTPPRDRVAHVCWSANERNSPMTIPDQMRHRIV